MWRNYFRVTLRNLYNQKYFTAINTIGLGLGLSACLLIFLFVQDELGYESHLPSNAYIYRLVQDTPMGEHLSRSATVPFAVKAAFERDFPEVRNSVLIFRPSSWGFKPLLQNDGRRHYEDDLVFAENSIFKVFPFDVVFGTTDSALCGRNRMVLSRSTAERYFGTANPVGRTIQFTGVGNVKVVAVVEDLPNSTHLDFDIAVSMDTYRSFLPDPAFLDRQWIWVAAWYYFTLDDPSDASDIAALLPDFVQQHYPDAIAREGAQLQIQSVRDIHLTSDREMEFKPNGNLEHVYLFSTIAILILVIGIVNFINLGTSRSSLRAKEVGIRKVLGASKPMLIAQFIGEAVLSTFMALVAALFFLHLAMPWFNQLTKKDIALNFWNNGLLLIGLFALLVVVGIAAGIYPALVLSRFKPTEVLKGHGISMRRSALLRRILVVGQFVVSSVLIICIGIVFKQLRYIQHKDLGFNQQRIMLVDVNLNGPQYAEIKQALQDIEGVSAVASIGGSLPGQSEVIENAFMPEPTGGRRHPYWFSVMLASDDFEKVLELEFLQGGGFPHADTVGKPGFILNESAAKTLGWEGNVVGKPLYIWNSHEGETRQSGEVIGLVKDFHYRPLYDRIKPLVIRPGRGQLCIKMQSLRLDETIAEIEAGWETVFDGMPFRYSLMERDFTQLYVSEEKFSLTIQYFSVLAIFIACLGLLGLSSFVTENRQKEIGVRKVNGARSGEILTIIAKEFIKLVVIAYLIAVPFAYVLGTAWLQEFSYKTKVGADVFVVSGILVLLVALSTISYHTIKAALTDPVKALRYE